jgi:hypothetical protein
MNGNEPDRQASNNLVLRSARLRASRRTATGEAVPLAILRDAVLRTAPQDEVLGSNSTVSGLIGFIGAIG